MDAPPPLAPSVAIGDDDDGDGAAAADPAAAPHALFGSPDCLALILACLPTLGDLLNACQVSKPWRCTAEGNDKVWQRAYVQRFGEPDAWERCGRRVVWQACAAC